MSEENQNKIQSEIFSSTKINTPLEEIDEIYETSIIADNKISSPSCGQVIRLPESMVNKIKSSKYI